MDKLCLNCKKVVYGRIDKKFCDDQCRSTYNNTSNTEANKYIKSIDRLLKRNRSILQRLNPEGKIKVKAIKLTNLGYNFNYHTHHYKTQKGDNYFFCYEYGYLKLSETEYLLVKKTTKN